MVVTVVSFEVYPYVNPTDLPDVEMRLYDQELC